MITKRQVPVLRVGRTIVARSSALPSRIDKVSLPTILLQATAIDLRPIANITHLTVKVNRSCQVTLRIYFIRDGKLRDFSWDRNGERRMSHTIIDTGALGAMIPSAPADL